MSNKYYLPHSENLLSANGMQKHFSQIKAKYTTQNQVIVQQSDIEDLIYYLSYHYCDDKGIKEQIDLTNCEFFVALPPEPKNSYFCFWIRDKSTKKELHFSTSRQGFIAPSTDKNFRNALIAILIPYKLKIRKRLATQCSISYSLVNLWHITPTTEEIINEFISSKNIRDKLAEIVSANGLGNNTPYLLAEYKHLEQEFLEFYFEKIASDELKYQLKATAS